MVAHIHTYEHIVRILSHNGRVYICATVAGHTFYTYVKAFVSVSVLTLLGDIVVFFSIIVVVDVDNFFFFFFSVCNQIQESKIFVPDANTYDEI